MKQRKIHEGINIVLEWFPNDTENVTKKHNSEEYMDQSEI